MNKNGFSLLETIIAIAVLIFAMTAVFTLVSLGIRSVSLASNELTAYFLASEGIEFIRNIRDENVISRRNIRDENVISRVVAFDRLSGCLNSGCVIDVRGGGGVGIITPCQNPPGCPPLRFDQERGIYNHDIFEEGKNEDSIFKREIIIPSLAGDEITVRSIVSWRQPNTQFGLRNFIIETNLFNTAF